MTIFENERDKQELEMLLAMDAQMTSSLEMTEEEFAAMQDLVANGNPCLVEGPEEGGTDCHS